MKNTQSLLLLLLLTISASVFATDIHIKRLNNTAAPKVHIWTNTNNTDIPITNVDNWPTNLPITSEATNDWFSYSFDNTIYGCLFVYDDLQTDDFKYYTGDRWILLNEDGSLKSISEFNPENANEIIITESDAPKSNGKYDEGESIVVTITNPGGKDIYYTTDGTDPSAVIGTINGTLYTTPLTITENTTLKVSLAGGYYSGYPILGTPEAKTYEFEETIVIPTFTYSTTPSLNDNGTYPEGTTVAVTFNLNYPTNNPDWDIYYSLDGNDVDLSKINGGGYNNPIRYTGSFDVTSDLVVYAKLYNTSNGYSQGVSPMVFKFEQPSPKYTVYAKKENANSAPKIHVWRADGETGPTITNPTNWPNNLSQMEGPDAQGWYSFTFEDVTSYGTLFILGNVQTPDYKFYEEDHYFLFDDQDNLISNTTTNPEGESIILTMSRDIEPNANGKYPAGTEVTVTFQSNGGYENRYIAYTTDGTDPATSSTFTQYNKTEGYVPTLKITSNTNLRAIEEQLYRNDPRSNEVSFNFEFEEPISNSVVISADVSPNSNGKYNENTILKVALTNTDSSETQIYYTNDGSTPTVNSYQYSHGAPLTVSASVTIKAATEQGIIDGNITTETFTFEEPTPQFRIYAKKEGATTAPQIHVWRGEGQIGPSITNSNEWPNNLPQMATTPEDGWYYFTFDQVISYGTLFILDGTQTDDFKFYSEDRWFLFDEDNNLISNTETKPEDTETVPSFTYSTTPALSDNGTYTAGTTVSTTFNLSYPSDNPNWVIYYSLDGNAVDLDNVGTSNQNAILYTDSFDITNDLVVYAKLVNTVTGQQQSVSPMIYTFVEPSPEYTIYVKTTNNTIPKIHVWRGDGETGPKITNSSEWPNNLPQMTNTDDNWYSFSFNEVNSYGTLFILDGEQTDDYKFYSENRWFLFDENNNLISNTTTNPDTTTSYEVVFNENKTPNNNGKYIIGDTVEVTLSNPSNLEIYYTTDGSDPSAIVGSINGSVYSGPISISETTTIKASTAGGYYVGYPVLGTPYVKTYEFEVGTPKHTVYVKKTTDLETAPKIHVWTKVNGQNQPITDASNLPVTAPIMAGPNSEGWYSYEVEANDYAIALFVGEYSSYLPLEYYNNDRYILLNHYGVSVVSNTETKPNDEAIYIRQSGGEDADVNGIFGLGDYVSISIESPSDYPIYYTTDGSDPSFNNGSIYEPGVTNYYTTKQVTIKASFLIDNQFSTPTTKTFFYNKVQTPEVQFITDIVPDSNGKFITGDTVNTKIELNYSCQYNDDCVYVTYYTTDNSDPSTSSTRLEYNGAEQITVTTDTTIKAYTIGGDGTNTTSSFGEYKIVFDPIFVHIPEIIITTNHEANNQGNYPRGTELEITLSLSDVPNKDDWKIYYSTKRHVNLEYANSGLDYALLYQSPILLQDDIFNQWNPSTNLYITLINTVTGQKQIVPTNTRYTQGQPVYYKSFEFDRNNGYSVYIKREGYDQAPRIHFWTNETGTNIPLTDSSDWPNNLFSGAGNQGNGWYSVVTSLMETGWLFIYSDNYQTEDFKYFSEETYILLNYDGSLKSITNTRPESSDRTNQTEKGTAELIISPNPTNDQFIVNYANNIKEEATITIYDLSGKVLFVENIAETTIINKEYSSSNLGLGAGIYLVSISTNNTNEIKRLVVQ